MTRQIRRRAVIGSIGAVTAGGLLAGCSTETGGEDGGNESGDGEGTETGGGGGGDGGGGTESVEVPSDVSDYLSDANNFDGQMVDATGTDSPTVEVGVGDNGLAFGPAAIQVSSGATVTWEWTGAGGAHNVVHEEGNFESELYNSEGATFEYAFEESGTFLYYCQPHQTQGMLGAVVVE